MSILVVNLTMFFIMFHEKKVSRTLDIIANSFDIIDENNMTFDQKCDKYGEWESIDNNVFIKRNAIYYFIDSNWLRIHVLRRGSLSQNFSLHVKLTDNSHKVKAKFFINQTRLMHGFSSSKFFFSMIDANLDFTQPDLKYLKDSMKDLKMSLRVREIISRNQTLAYMSVKMRNIIGKKFSEKKGSLMCAKCFYLNKTDGLLPLKWWIEVNKQGGYDNVFVCDHLMQKHPSFDELFETHKEFLILGRLNCIPNLQGLEKYLKLKYINYTQMEYMNTGEFDVTKMDTINKLILNECYMEHMDTYKYITVMDIDESKVLNS